MTANELYKITKALMFEKSSSTIYDDYLIPNLNRILVELFDENNALRAFKGKQFLKTPQVVTSKSDELTYEDEYVMNVIPLGLASRFLIDDDLNKYSIFSTDYNNARVFNQRFNSKEGIDDASAENTTV